MPGATPRSSRKRSRTKVWASTVMDAFPADSSTMVQEIRGVGVSNQASLPKNQTARSSSMVATRHSPDGSSGTTTSGGTTCRDAARGATSVPMRADAASVPSNRIRRTTISPIQGSSRSLSMPILTPSASSENANIRGRHARRAAHQAGLQRPATSINDHEWPHQASFNCQTRTPPHRSRFSRSHS